MTIHVVSKAIAKMVKVWYKPRNAILAFAYMRTVMLMIIILTKRLKNKAAITAAYIVLVVALG